MNEREFVILSDEGSLRAGNTTRQDLVKLKANGFTPVNHGEDFLCALADGENVFFLPKNEQDINRLYDECNVFSLSYSKKEKLLQAYGAKIF